MWDGIAKKVYGTEQAMDSLMRTNPDYLNVAVFGAGVTLFLPQTIPQENSSGSVPPWRK